ncbi:MAG: DUF4172 domain-containing protein [Saprospiraceae bacterium]
MSQYIHQNKHWPQFTWDLEALLPRLTAVRNLQGRLSGKMETLGFELRNEAQLETLTADVIKSSEIEGEQLDLAQVRSSLARKLGIEISGSVDSDRNVDGVVEIIMLTELFGP